MTALLVTLAGCSTTTVSLHDPPMSPRTHRLCRMLVDDLPDSLADRAAQPVSPADALGAAYGDSGDPVVVRCGVGRPRGFDRFSVCQEVNGVDWFAPSAQAADQQADVVLTTVGRTPRVELDVPADERPPAAAMVDLTGVVKAHTTVRDRCR